MMNKKMRDDFKNIFKSTFIARENNKSEQEIQVKYTNSNCAGAELLQYYQIQWKKLRDVAEHNAEYAENIDNTMTQIHVKTKKQLEMAVEMSTLLSSLPQIIDTVEQCNNQIIKLKDKFKDCEDMLISVESLIEQLEFERRQQEHRFQLTMYKEKKLYALEQCRVSLAMKQSEKMRQLEIKQRQLLSEKQKAANELFENDLKQFKLEGKLPERVCSDVQSTASSLEEIILDDNDSSELDDFLNK